MITPTDAQCAGSGIHSHFHIEAGVADHRRRFSDRARISHRLFNHGRSEEHTSELQSLMRISYAVFCLKKKTKQHVKKKNTTMQLVTITIIHMIAMKRR